MVVPILHCHPLPSSTPGRVSPLPNISCWEENFVFRIVWFFQKHPRSTTSCRWISGLSCLILITILSTVAWFLSHRQELKLLWGWIELSDLVWKKIARKLFFSYQISLCPLSVQCSCCLSATPFCSFYSKINYSGWVAGWVGGWVAG